MATLGNSDEAVPAQFKLRLTSCANSLRLKAVLPVVPDMVNKDPGFSFPVTGAFWFFTG